MNGINLEMAHKDLTIIEDPSESSNSKKNNSSFSGPKHFPIPEITPFPKLNLSSSIHESIHSEELKSEKNREHFQNFANFLKNYLYTKKEESNLLLTKQRTIQRSFVHGQFLYNCFLQFVFSVISIISSIIEYEHTVLTVPGEDNIYYHTHSNKKEIIAKYDIDSDYFDYCQFCSKISSYVTLIASILLWITIYFDLVLYHQVVYSAKTKEYSKVCNNFDAWFNLILKYIFFVLCPNPMTYGIDIHLSNSNYQTEYIIPLNSFFTSICFFRVWFIFKYYLAASNTYTQRAFRVCKTNGVKFGLGFPFKSHMSRDPLIMDTLLYLFSWILCAYNIRIFERNLDHINGNNFGNFYNALWFVFITMTTVGFGDLTTSTIYGRIFAMIGCISGVFLMSLFVVTVSGYLNIQGIELNVFNVLNTATIMDKQKKNGEKVVYEFIKARKNFKEKKGVEPDKYNKIFKKYIDKIKSNCEKFKEANLELEQNYPHFSCFDSILEYLEFFDDIIVNLNKEIKRIHKMVDNIYEKTSRAKKEKKRSNSL